MNDTTFQGNGKIAYVPVVVNAKPPKPTNYDRLRAKSVEEMAEFLEERVSDAPWCNEDAPFKPGSDECALEDCIKCALDWLQREANP